MTTPYEVPPAYIRHRIEIRHPVDDPRELYLYDNGIRPTEKEWEAFYGRLMHLIARNRDNQDATGIFARRLLREMAHLWTFLEQEGVAPTNNHAERMIRFAVLWRKCSQGTSSDKGNRWVERILTLRQTCRLRTLKTYPILVDTVQRYFKGQEADLSWFTQG